MALKIDTAPALTPVTLAEAKSHLRVTGTDENDIITNMIDSATYWAESYTGYKLLDQKWIYYLDKFPVGDIVVPFPPLIAVTYVKYYNSSDVLTTLTEDTDYRVDIKSIPGRIEVINSWPGSYDKVNAVEIKFQCGYAAASGIEEDIRSAILMRIGDLYENRQSSYVSTGPLSAIDGTLTAKSLLDFYRIFDRTW
jgi:uncharacterized phiE125 gp8 family phage protein